MEKIDISQIAILLSHIFFIVIVLFLVYAFFTGDLFFIGGGGTADDCVPNYMGGCDL